MTSHEQGQGKQLAAEEFERQVRKTVERYVRERGAEAQELAGHVIELLPLGEKKLAAIFHDLLGGEPPKRARKKPPTAK